MKQKFLSNKTSVVTPSFLRTEFVHVKDVISAGNGVSLREVVGDPKYSIRECSCQPGI